MITRMELVFNVTSEKWRPSGRYATSVSSSSRLDLVDKQELLDEFARFLANEMKKLLKRRIRIQYKFLYWEPLSPSYLQFKRDHGLYEDIWRSTGLLYKSIKVMKRGTEITVGIDPKAKYPNGTNVLFVAKCMEFGTKNMPARPLFGPTVKFMRRNISKYWMLFLTSRYIKDESEE